MSIVSVMDPCMWSVLSYVIRVFLISLFVSYGWKMFFISGIDNAPCLSMYFNGRCKHFYCYMPLFLCLLVCLRCCFSVFSIVLYVRSDTFSLNTVPHHEKSEIMLRHGHSADMGWQRDLHAPGSDGRDSWALSRNSTVTLLAEIKAAGIMFMCIVEYVRW
jgi:hypothetical protein